MWIQKIETNFSTQIVPFSRQTTCPSRRSASVKTTDVWELAICLGAQRTASGVYNRFTRGWVRKTQPFSLFCAGFCFAFPLREGRDTTIAWRQFSMGHVLPLSLIIIICSNKERFSMYPCCFSNLLWFCFGQRLNLNRNPLDCQLDSQQTHLTRTFQKKYI